MFDDMSTALESLRAHVAGRYQVERELGRGGMGAVYLARDVRLDRPVALKVLPPEFASDAGLRERFLRETRMAASFSHPNIVPVYSIEDHADTLAFAMGFVEGESLGARVTRMGPLPVREVVRIMQDVCYALAYAHGRGVVHRDLKPDNIMIERATGRALLMDFGIARAISAPVSGTQALTRVGEVVGTPQYMSPEQATGDAVDGRSDLYSLGLVAYYALTGVVAMDGTSTQQILVRQLTETPPSVRSVRTDVPAALDDVLAACLAKEPPDRVPDASTLIERIDAAQVAAPEVPVGIRLFAQESRTIVLLGVAFLLFWLPVISSARGRSNSSVWDAIVPLVVLTAILIARLIQTRHDAQDLMHEGWTPAEIRTGVLRTFDEQRDRLTARRADPRMQLARKRTVQIALTQAIIAMGLLAYFWSQRVMVRPNYFSVSASGIFAGYTGLAAVGVSAFLLIRSPFRMSPPDRVLRLLWQSPLGWWMSRGGSVAPSANTPVSARPATARNGAASITPLVLAQDGTSSAGLAALETRVAALEVWQSASQFNGAVPRE
jgi:eukaryotic-like serine/threonine-protein kinase